MKKIFYILLILVVFFVRDVYAVDSYTLKRGESFIIGEGRCTSDENMVRFYVDKVNYQCLMTSIYKTPEPECDEEGNCMVSTFHTYVGPLYGGGTVPMPGYNVGFGSDVEHEEGKIKLSELVALVNDVDNVTRQSVLRDLEEKISSFKPEGATKVILESGSNNNTLYINVGWDSAPVLIKIDYDEVKNQLSYTNETTDAYLSIIEPVVLYSFYEWTMEASPNYTNAKEIRDNEEKASYVDEEVLDDGVSGLGISGDTGTGNYMVEFNLVLSDDRNDKVIESYNINSERANEPEDPTEPTQPTEPGKQPNTGSYLSLIAVLWLAMFGMVFISCRKTMFKKI